MATWWSSGTEEHQARERSDAPLLTSASLRTWSKHAFAISKDFAVDGVLRYARHLSATFTAISIAVSEALQTNEWSFFVTPKASSQEQDPVSPAKTYDSYPASDPPEFWIQSIKRVIREAKLPVAKLAIRDAVSQESGC